MLYVLVNEYFLPFRQGLQSYSDISFWGSATETRSVLGGGIIPMPISILHTGVDVILHEKTGKTSGEHVLSDITQKD